MIYQNIIYCNVDDYYYYKTYPHSIIIHIMIKGSLGGETSVLRTFRMSGK